MKNIKKLDENAKWWKGDDTITWAIEDKKGDWWLVGGSEFPEKKLTSKMKIKKVRGDSTNRLNTLWYISIVLASALGISLALNLISFLL
jgi:hypothetical protein